GGAFAPRPTPAMTARRAPARTAALPQRTAMTALFPNHGRNGLMSYSTQQIRNVALAGHPGAGKTILFEALLHAGGALTTAGTLERGTTVSDFDPMKRVRGHSIDAAIASIDHEGIHVNRVDTPGYPDFRGPTLSALAALETGAIVVGAHTRE